MKDKTLEDLEESSWEEPDFRSFVTLNAHRLRKTPIGAYTADDLRFMLAQQIGVSFLLPHALEMLKRLERTVSDETACYINEAYENLFMAILKLPSDIWQDNPGWRQSLCELLHEELNRDLPWESAPESVEAKTVALNWLSQYC